VEFSQQNLRQIAWNSETMPYYTPETFTPQGLGLIVWTTNNAGLTTLISVLDNYIARRYVIPSQHKC
jgi:hypothetical protein